MDGRPINLFPPKSTLRRALPLLAVIIALASVVPAGIVARHRGGPGRTAGRSLFDSGVVSAQPSLLPIPTIAHLAGPRMITMEITAYCPCTLCCGPKAQGITASGKTVDYNAGRFVAADTALLPFGTRVSIPGYHEGEVVEVIDRGGAIKGNKLDVYFPSHEAALQWGRQTVVVGVLD